MADSFETGRLKEFRVVLINADGSRKIGITNLIMQMSITEDIFKNTLYGSIRIRDAINLLGGRESNFPILGEEFIEIDYTVDWVPEPISVSLRFAVFGISSIEYYDNNTKKEYTLNICSEENIFDATTLVMKGYTGLNSDNAKSILEDYLFINQKDVQNKEKRTKKIDKLQDTKGIQNVCIPRLPPIEAVHFLARRSIADSTFKSGTYLFFENFKGFNFCDIEYLIAAGIEKAKDENALEDSEDALSDFRYVYENPTIFNKNQINLREKQTIINMYHRSFFDTLEKLKQGMFESNILVYDYVNKKTISNRFRFLNNPDKTNNDSMALGGKNDLSFPENSVTFLNKVISKTEENSDAKYNKFFFIPKDNSSTTNDTYLDQIYPARASYLTRLAQNMFTIDTFGNPRINAGDVIYINIPSGEGREPESYPDNRFISGFYLVCTINHIFTQTTYQAKMDIYKNAFSEKVESTEEAKNTKVTGNDNNALSNQFFREPVDLLDSIVPDQESLNNFLNRFLR